MSTPASAHGKICYVQLPSLNPEASAEFFKTVFGWNIRSHGDGTLAFDEPTGAVSGMWETRLKAADDPGFLVSIMVKNVEESAKAVVEHGGSIVKEPWFDGDQNLALVRDLDGNMWSLFNGGEQLD